MIKWNDEKEFKERTREDNAETMKYETELRKSAELLEADIKILY